MTFEQLKVFDIVARHLSITKAAGEIGITQPTASKQIKLLEDECGVKFYVRTGHGIQLTDEGRLFWDTAGQILQKIGELSRRFGIDTNESKANTIRIGTQSPSAFLLPETLKDFRVMHPSIQPILRTGNSKALEQMVLDSSAEIALVTHPSYHPHLVVEPFRSEKVKAMISATHPLARKRELSREEFARAPFVIKLGGKIAKRLIETGLRLNIVMQCESSEALKAAVRSGVGIGLLYRDSVKLDLKRHYLRVIKIPGLDQIEAKCFIIYQKEMPLSAYAQGFLVALRKNGN